jgi:hypothetical protein
MTDPYLAQPAETGPRLLRIEARNSQTPIERKPAWIKTKLKTGPADVTSAKLPPVNHFPSIEMNQGESLIPLPQ